MDDQQKKKRRTWLTSFAKALFPRFLFLGHGTVCIHVLVGFHNNVHYWYLWFCLGILVLEGVFNVIVRGGKEFHWFSPSAFLFCVVLIITMTFLRQGQLECRLKKITTCKTNLTGTGFIIEMLNGWTLAESASIIEQSGLLILIVGRWLLPKGSISKDQFCQILLIYIGTAADIVEFSEMHNDDLTKLRDNLEGVLHGVMAVWAISVVQFSLTIALPEEALKAPVEEEDEDDEAFKPTSYFRSKVHNKVAPMSYMHYKSLLREGLNNKNNENNSPITRQPINNNNRSPAQSQQTFQERYPLFSFNAANTPQMPLRSKPAMLEPIPSPRHRTESNSTFYDAQKRPAVVSSTSLNQQRHNTISFSSTSTSSKINMPQGSRTPMNIGSPPTSLRSHTSKTSLHSVNKKTSVGERNPKNNVGNGNITTPQSMRSNKVAAAVCSTTIDRISRESTTSSTSRNHTGIESPPIKTWDRLLERIPFSKKRRRKISRRKDSTKEDNSLGIGKKEVKNCFYANLDLIGIILPVCMQDGPFFVIRFLLLAHFGIVPEMIYLLVTKNALVVIVQIYRILLMNCSEPRKEESNIDENDSSNRVRAAMNTNQKLSGKTSFRNKRASIAVQALSRMQARLLGKQRDTYKRQSRQRNGDIEIG